MAGDRVYLGTMAGNFYCLGAADGKDVWVRKVGGPVFHTACVTPEGLVVFGAGAADIRRHPRMPGRLVLDPASGDRAERLLAARVAPGPVKPAVHLPQAIYSLRATLVAPSDLHVSHLAKK